MTAIGSYSIGTRAIADQIDAIEPIACTSIDSAEAFGTINVLSQNQITTISMDSAETFDQIKTIESIEPNSIASEETFDDCKSIVHIQCAEIQTDENFGTINLKHSITAGVIDEQTLFGTITTDVSISNCHVDNETEFGTIIIPNNVSITNVGDINSEENFGTITVSAQQQNNDSIDQTRLRIRHRRSSHTSANVVTPTINQENQIKIGIRLVEINLKQNNQIEQTKISEKFTLHTPSTKVQLNGSKVVQINAKIQNVEIKRRKIG